MFSLSMRHWSSVAYKSTVTITSIVMCWLSLGTGRKASNWCELPLSVIGSDDFVFEDWKTNARYTTKTSVGTSVFSRLLLKSRELQSAFCGFFLFKKRNRPGSFSGMGKTIYHGKNWNLGGRASYIFFSKMGDLVCFVRS